MIIFIYNGLAITLLPECILRGEYRREAQERSHGCPCHGINMIINCLDNIIMAAPAIESSIFNSTTLKSFLIIDHKHHIISVLHWIAQFNCQNIPQLSRVPIDGAGICWSNLLSLSSKEGDHYDDLIEHWMSFLFW